MSVVDEALNDYNKFMAYTKSLEGLRLITKEYESGSQQVYVCFLKNHHQAADFFYGSSHGALQLFYNQHQSYVFLSISSIDDSYITFFGPSEDLEAGTKRIELLVNEINSWDGWIPTVEQCQEIEKRCGMYWNK